MTRLIHRKIILQIHIHAQVAARPRFGDDFNDLAFDQGPEELPRALNLRLPGLCGCSWLRAINCCIAQHPSPLRLITLKQHPVRTLETPTINRSGGAGDQAQKRVLVPGNKILFPAVCV